MWSETLAKPGRSTEQSADNICFQGGEQSQPAETWDPPGAGVGANKSQQQCNESSQGDLAPRVINKPWPTVDVLVSRANPWRVHSEESPVVYIYVSVYDS